MVEGNAARDLRRWCAGTGRGVVGRREGLATDLAESYRAGLQPAPRPCRASGRSVHVVRVANRCLDTVRRRVQNELLGHRGRKNDPLYRIRKLLLSGGERLDERGSSRMLLGLRLGDPDDHVLAPGWRKSPCVTSISPTIRAPPPCCSTRPSPAVSPTTCRRFARSGTPSRAGGRRSSPTMRPELRTARPKDSTSV